MSGSWTPSRSAAKRHRCALTIFFVPRNEIAAFALYSIAIDTPILLPDHYFARFFLAINRFRPKLGASSSTNMASHALIRHQGGMRFISTLHTHAAWCRWLSHIGARWELTPSTSSVRSSGSHWCGMFWLIRRQTTWRPSQRPNSEGFSFGFGR